MKKAMMLALAAASVMMVALPAVASAESWNIDWNNGVHTKALNFSVDGTGVPKLKTHTGEALECADVSGTGSYSTTTTGTIALTFTGCKDEATGVTCTSSGSASGTIATTGLTFHNVYVTHNSKKGPAVLITPNAGHFASFGCTIFGFGAHFKMGGTGLIGTVAQCGIRTSFSINFQASASGTQTHSNYTGGTYDLSWSRNGSAAVTASQEGASHVNFTQSVNATCTL